MKLYFPNEGADYPYVDLRHDNVPQIGATLHVNQSDNPLIVRGKFKIVDVAYNINIVNQRLASSNGVVVTLERVS